MNRLSDIDRAKSLAIILVVTGHLFGKHPPAGGEMWYVPESLIYAFHMPLFMFLSGFVFFLRGYQDRALENYAGFFGSRAKRLLLPFVLMGLFVLAGKVVSSRFVHVDNNPDSILSGLLGIVNIGEPTVMFIWFLYVLFVFSVATPWLFRLCRRNIYILAALALVLFFIPPVTVLYADRITKMYLFFIVGGYCALHAPRWQAIVDRYLPWLWAGFAVLSAAFVLVNLHTQVFVAGNLWTLGISAFAIPAIIGLMRRPGGRFFAPLDFLQPYVMSIYLFNVIFIGVAKAVLSKIFPFDSGHMILAAPVLLAAGLVGPILLKFLILKRWKVSDELTS